MPRDANGNYTLPAGNPVASGTIIESAWANSTMQDLATAMTDSLSRSGQGGMIGPFKLFDGAVAAPGLAFVNEATSGLYRDGSGKLAMSVKGLNAMGWQEASIITYKPIALYSPDGSASGVIAPQDDDSVKFQSVTGIDFTNADGTQTWLSVGPTKVSAFAAFEAKNITLLQDPGSALQLQPRTGDIAKGWLMYSPAPGSMALYSIDVNADRMTLDSVGNLIAAGNVTAYSDARLKEDIRPLEPLAMPPDLRAVRYRRTDSDREEVGVIAQELQKVLPECVVEGPDGMLSVDYGRAALMLVLAGHYAA